MAKIKKINRFWRATGKTFEVLAYILIFCSFWEFMKFIFVSCIITWMLAVDKMDNPLVIEQLMTYIQLMGALFVILMYGLVFLIIKHVAKKMEA